MSPKTVTVCSQEKTPQKNATPARYPSARSRSQRRFEFPPENQTAANKGVSVSQQSQV